MSDIKKIMPVPQKQIKITEKFWDTYMERIRNVVIPYQWDAINDRISDAEPSHALANFKIAAGLEQGEFYGMVFQDSDVAKWLEAVAYSLINHPDAELEKTADGVIDILEKAQREDGYLDTYYLLKEKGKEWTNLRECHELYCAGHMMEAAVAYYEATGKKKFLDIMSRYADLIDSKFGTEEGKMRGYPGHQEIELALVRMYRATKNEKYLRLSKYFIDERGKQPYYFDIEAEKRGNTSHWHDFNRFDKRYNQTQAPVREQISVEGHSVRALYMLAGMADVAIETDDKELLQACKRLYKNLISRRLYVTGGLGSSAYNEGFTFDYDLPNDTVYAETCASIALIFFLQRMLKSEPNSNYADVMEQALYNTVLSSMSLDGQRFFYVNPLEVQPAASELDPYKHHVKAERQKWFACACCPPNLARLMTSLGRYVYGINGDSLFVHLYIGNEAEVELCSNKVKISQKTQYPFCGKINLKVSAESQTPFKLCLRIPSWCEKAEILINGELFKYCENIQNGYAVIDRVWNNSDNVQLNFDMKVRRVKCNPLVKENVGKVAIQCGPVVYCMEEADNGVNLHQMALKKDSAFTCEYDADLLGGVNVITADGEVLSDDWKDDLYRFDTSIPSVTKKLRFIPYFAWGNRSSGEMAVWVHEK